MKHKSLVLIGTVLATLIISLGFGVQNARATTGCFTDTIGHPFETFICWMLDNGITSGTAPGLYSPEANVTRGQMAVFMQRQAEIPPSTGEFHINVGQTQWVPHTFYDGYVEQYTGLSHFRGATAGIKGFILSPNLPIALYGRAMLLKGVRICYTGAATAGGTLTRVELFQFSGGSSVVPFKTVLDTTVRADAACREYLITVPDLIWTTDTIALYIEVTLGAASDWVGIANTSFILTPSASTAIFGPVPDLRPALDVPFDPKIGVNP